MIIRENYINKILPFIDVPVVKILTGIRRCGKSTILAMIKNYLRERGVLDDRIVSINFDNLKYEYINDNKILYDTIQKQLTTGKRIYLFLDEIQEVSEWEKAINSLSMEYDVDIYITGSNSRMLSSEISTYLTGRYVTIEVFPLSFSEFLDFKRSYRGLNDVYTEFDEYLKKGGFPLVNLQHMEYEQAYAIVYGIYNSTIYRDIVQRNNITAINQLEKIVKFLFDNVGKTFSANSIFTYFKDQKRAVPIETIYNYLSLLEKAYIVGKVQRYDINGKELLKTQEKYYLADSALKYALLGFQQTSVASMLENIIYLELRRRGYTVNIGKDGNKEIDFIAKKQDELIYVQIAKELNAIKTEKREFENLLAVKDNYQKYVIVLDKYKTDNYKGINVVQIADFLLQKNY